LNRPFGDKGLLHGMRAITRQSFDGGDDPAFELADRQLAAARRGAVDMDDAKAALAGVAAIFGAGEIGRVAQRPEQRRLWVDPVLDRLPVHGKAHG
jgi:hypothetical protein